MSVKTYKELFLFLQSNPASDIRCWLAQRDWKGKDKQEALLRLTARLGLITKLKDFHMCIGNFNMNTIKTQESFRDVFFTQTNDAICLNDKGDASDLTGLYKSDPKHLLTCTSKCLNRLSLKKLDVDYIATNFRQYEEQGYKMTLCIAVRDADEFHSVMNRSERTTSELKRFIQNHETIVIDWNDLNDAYHDLKRIYGETSFDDLVSITKSPLVLRFHQRLCCIKTARLKTMTRKILWGHIQRSGKSYIMGGVVIDDSRDKSTCNYLILTTAPNETIVQYLQVFATSQFEDFNVIHLHGKCKKPERKKKNIIICSKQFLQSKMEDEKKTTRSIPWLKNMTFDIRFVDESHNGGTTELAQRTLDYYGSDAFTIYITATYSKPTRDYSIPRDHWILWDLEDITLCKNLNDGNRMDRLIEKHGDDVRRLLGEYSMENIIKEFSMYPELEILTMKIHPGILSEILNETRDNLYGWSLESCFLLKQGVDQKRKIIYLPEFQNREQNLKLWRTIFGKRGLYNSPDNEYPDDLVFMERIRKICQNPETSSRYTGDMEHSVIMAFLPSNNIDLVSQATKQLLEAEHVISADYDILCINSKTTTDPKQAILDSKIRARNRGKKGVLVLSGRQCSLGATIDDCDIVILLNGSNSYDMIFQMMFRCMTEGVGKKRGFVIDPNIHRVVETVMMEYGAIVRPDSHPRDAVQYLLQQRLINLNSDHWMECFGHRASQVSRLTDSIYDVYSSKMSGALENLFRRMSLKQDMFSKNEYDVMKCIFDNLHVSSEKKTRLLESLERIDTDDTIGKGIERTIVVNDEPVNDGQRDEEEKRIDPIDILRPVSIVISILTIHAQNMTSLEEMFSLIEDDEVKTSILLNQVRVWWGNGVSNRDIEQLVRIFKKYLEKDAETTRLIRQVKELFCKNIRNSGELSKIIDRYLIPQEAEKKKNAEVSTPASLRKDMLDSIPSDFWTRPRRVFEPCCGKGGFLLDIVDRFMSGLQALIPDEKERYRTIVEECLFWSDINEMNIFICRLLLDPYNEYNLRYYEGDTLKLDIQTTWGLDKGFDAVIGNPPYNSSGNTGTGNTIWQLFVWKAIEEWTSRGEGRYVVMVHPSGWRKPNTEKGKFTGLYHKMVSENHMRRLSIHGVKDGLKTFRCGTRYDWYVVERINGRGRSTRIRDERGEEKEEVMNDGWEWFPNYGHEEVKKLLARDGDERCPIIQSMSAYEPRKKWMSKVRDEQHPYPCVHSTPKSGIRYMYSSVNDRGMFGIPKVIFGDSGTHHVVVDQDGRYGMTHHSMGVQIRDKNECDQLVRFLKSPTFDEMVNMCSWSSFALDWNVFRYFRRNFYEIEYKEI